MTDATVAEGRRPNLRDIAENAEVAVSTVSRYLSGDLALKPETEARIITAMEELGYARGARAARRPQPTWLGTIGLIVPQVGSEYFGRIADSVVAHAEAHRHSVLIASTSNHSRKQLEYVDLLAGHEICGLIYSGGYASNSALAGVVAQGTPVVVIDEALTGGPPTDTVLVDDYAGAYQAVAHLTSLGHTRIALVTGPTSLNSARERRRGYADALHRAGIDSESQVQLSGPFSEDFGVGAISRLMAATRQPSAVFAASDTIAVGMMVGARNSGIAIPDELSIVGFDGGPGAAHVSPRLTTLRTPVDTMAETAVAALLERIEHPERDVQVVATPVVLVIGESTAPPRGASS